MGPGFLGAVTLLLAAVASEDQCASPNHLGAFSAISVLQKTKNVAWKGKQPTPVKSDAVTSFVGAFGAVSNSTNSFAPVSTSSPRRQLNFDPEQR
mgnify:CR=1 FL=1